MKFLSSVLAAAFTASSFLFSPVSAFTNGTLLPAYMCGPTLATSPSAAADGLPKSLGGVLPYFVLNTNPFPVTTNGALPNAPLDAGVGGQLNHTQLLVSGFHNRPLSIVPFKQVVHITVIAAATAANPNPVAGQIVPGATHILQIQSTPDDLGVFDDNVALDGTLVYAMDLNLTQRVGTFTAFGPNMQAFPGCGPNNVGAVHNQLLSDAGHYDGLEWTAPASLTPGHLVQFRGAAVTDNGFGGHSSTYPVVAANANTPPTKPTLTQVLVFGTSKAFSFFIDENRGSTTVKIASFTVTAQLSATAATAAQDIPVSPTAAATITPPLATQLTTCKASPCKTDVAALLKAAGTAGGFLALTVVATGTNGVNSAPSNAAIIQIGTITTTTATTAVPTTATPTVAPTTATPTKAATTATPTTATPTTKTTATTVKPTTALATTATPTTATPTTATPTTAKATTATPTTAAAVTGISLATVATHNVATSCWVVIGSFVYDLTNYVNNHPGGTAQITNNCGNDATMAYGAIGAHPASAAAGLPARTGVTNLGAVAVTAAKTVLFVQSYASPSGNTNLNAATIDQGFLAMCDNTAEANLDAANMQLAEDADNACAWQASYSQVLVNADAANGGVIAAAVTDGTINAATTTATTACTTTTNNDNTAMIIGISVGASILVLGLVAIGAFVYFKKNASQANSNQAMTNKMTSV